MSDRTNRKSRTGQGQTRRQQGKDKPIRLEDLIPKQNVTGGKRHIFGVSNPNLDQPRRKKED